ncbi:MAG: chromate resistance protein [Acidobacteria bacterium]|nr:chromate resistance protein [Acidobacteriota bacterium]
MQELGAVAVKQAVYVLPDTAESREDFEWLKVEIEGSGGEALVFSADQVNASADATLVEEFRRARQLAYAELATELQQAQRVRTSRQRPAGRRSDLSRYRQRFAAIERVDFFSSAGRDRVVALLADLEARSPSAVPQVEGAEGTDSRLYHGRFWVTRPRPGVDRMASAWLIRRFIDPGARFGFVTDAKAAPADAVPFDVFGAGFGHEADRCTFETLQARFDIHEPAVARLGEIVHDLDLKDNRFGSPEAATLGAAIDGLQLACADDAILLEQGMTLFEALYRSFAQATRSPKPRAVAGRTRKPSRPK